MSDDGGFPDPGQMTTDVSAGPTSRVTPRRLPQDDEAGDVDPGRWPDPGQESAHPGRERPDRQRG